ncbi:cysteinyl-tRNA synthetase [Nematocida ausubeli]|uniref:cysteine--tRNA ligase n=1 Tax=Nematocida ausubeli (strain ATCC PRA-371 / ERTm2) TaxID=1913371 RepID=A0A086IYZ9_NEMA1|nr:cysteinyl-tRNA synthetase [Nematocida ausubeli]KAI5132281.1 cysteinyl-tRNA synthetase [Nematocida ausubeli]KAI5133562.1 cysteinyl-tRNA synthetase [Nematocida ausubeli]KAI5147186.1 cysteinyl-tRNA synthetase [Nematocida ausubeli]KFG25117.1 cysteinyl-tRNA synthetase [Nematocida ausubeli]
MSDRSVGGLRSESKLKIYNTITKKKDELKMEGYFFKWYTCGPTVYDSAHIGHARSYITLDIIRKTLERYFGYTITYIMNITDIDDKIILKAKETMESLPENIHEEFKKLSINNIAEETEEQKRIHIATRAVSRKYEQEFFDDMAALGVDLPNYTTRVSDYVDEIINFIVGIEEKGYAYESEGSVYFNVEKYKETHKYPLMCNATTQEDQQSLLEEGEGKLTAGQKNRREDFVLWKASKEGEPAWTSKWGPGRPGWHIECSAMASNIAGGRIDMHSGGIDLMFPHHDNEIAQSEGHGLNNWVGHFLHTGHLHIEGMKMSKSLKNFIKVEELLKKGTTRELRLMFILQRYSGPMTYSEESLERAKVIDKKIFRYISLYTDTPAKSVNAVHPFTDAEREILQEFERTAREIDQAIKDDFNFPKALKLAVDLASIESKTSLREIHQQIAGYLKGLMHSIGLEIEVEAGASASTEMVEIISMFRNRIRDLAKSSADKKSYFEACDEIRKEMETRGFVIEDGNGQASSSVRKKC